MSATGRQDYEAPPRMAVLVVTVDEVEHRLREVLEDPAYESHGYTQSYDWKVTDVSPAIAGAVTVSRQILGGDVRSLGGWAIRETTGAAAAAVRLHDGSTVGNVLLSTIGLAAGGFAFFPPYGRGVEVSTGRVFIEVVAGSVEGVIYWR